MEELTNEITNEAIIIGTVESTPEISHHFRGETFYECMVSTSRLSGTKDTIRVVYSERLITRQFTPGVRIKAEGQLRSCNKLVGEKTKLYIYIYAKSIDFSDDLEDTNYVKLRGFFCRTPSTRTTPLGKNIADILLAVNREYNRSDYIPCILWGRNALYIKRFDKGTEVQLSGRLQSRIYHKIDENGNQVAHTAFELSVSYLKMIKEVYYYGEVD